MFNINATQAISVKSDLKISLFIFSTMNEEKKVEILTTRTRMILLKQSTINLLRQPALKV